MHKSIRRQLCLFRKLPFPTESGSFKRRKGSSQPTTYYSNQKGWSLTFQPHTRTKGFWFQPNFLKNWIKIGSFRHKSGWKSKKYVKFQLLREAKKIPFFFLDIFPWPSTNPPSSTPARHPRHRRSAISATMGTTFPARPEDASIFRTELEAGTRKSHGKTGKAWPAHGLRLAGWGKLAAGWGIGGSWFSWLHQFGRILLQLANEGVCFFQWEKVEEDGFFALWEGLRSFSCQSDALWFNVFFWGKTLPSFGSSSTPKIKPDASTGSACLGGFKAEIRLHQFPLGSLQKCTNPKLRLLLELVSLTIDI